MHNVHVTDNNRGAWWEKMSADGEETVNKKYVAVLSDKY